MSSFKDELLAAFTVAFYVGMPLKWVPKVTLHQPTLKGVPKWLGQRTGIWGSLRTIFGRVPRNS